MAPPNSTFHNASATSNTVNAANSKPIGIQMQWVPLIVFVALIILIIIVVAIPKGWIINFYNRIRSTKKHSPAPPRRFFALFSSRSHAIDQQRLKNASRQRREHDASFTDVHLREIRGYHKPDLQRVERSEPTVLEEVGLPLPVLHRDRKWKRGQGKTFLGSRTLGILRGSRGG